MATSSVQEEVLNKYSAEENNSKFSVFKTDKNDLEVKHRLQIPKDFCPESQCIEFKIESPVMRIIPKNQYKSVRNFHKKTQNRTQRRISPIEKKSMGTATKSHKRTGDHNTINTSIYIPRSIYNRSGISVDENSDFSEDQKSTTNSKVQSKINKFNALIKNNEASKKIQNVIVKSIENLTILIFRNRETLGDTGPHSSGNQKSITKYCENKVQKRINEFNALFQNINSSNELKKVLTKSIDDLSHFIYGQPHVQSRIGEFNALIQKMNTMTYGSTAQYRTNKTSKQNSNEYKDKEDVAEKQKVAIKSLQDFIVNKPGPSSSDSSEDPKSMINYDKTETFLEDVTEKVEDELTCMLGESGTSVAESSGVSENLKLMTDCTSSEVPFETEKVYTLKKNMSAIETIREDLTKSLEEIANFILSEPGTSVDTSSESLDDQEPMKDNRDCKVKSIINKFNAQIRNTIPSRKRRDDSKLFSSDSFVKKHINLFETVGLGDRKTSKVQENSNEKKTKFVLSGQCGPTCETVEKYLSVIEELKQSNDSNIVKRLILQRFENDIYKFIKSTGEDKLSGDSGNGSTCEHYFGTCSYAENESSPIRPTVNENSIETSQEVTERKFLEFPLDLEKVKLRHLQRNISGRSRCNGGTYWRNSIGTSHLSELVSTASYPLHPMNHRRKSEATYASVTESDWTIYSGDGTTGNLGPDQETTIDEESTRKSMAKFGGENSIISQISKAFEIFERCKCSHNNLGAIEAERILLVANLRTTCSMEDISTPVLDNIMNERRFREVRLSNIVIPITRISRRSSSMRFFVFVFRCGPTLLYSDLLWMDEVNLEVKVEENFIFRELPTDFEIIFQIYSLKAKITEKLKGGKPTSKGPLQKIMKKVFLPRRRSNRQNNSKISSFQISGEGYLNRHCINYAYLPIMNPIRPVGQNFKCDIDIIDF